MYHPLDVGTNVQLFIFGGFYRVTLLVAFGFLTQNFGKWQGPTNGTLSFSTNTSGVVFTRGGGGDTQALPTCCNQILS